ncbi:hypothetical protein [Pseudonocardia spinosispora]|uniref:hypothetical protein n=1 Tax=Pseudonocardia spinosispora TaxID=103441 RepID=UPI0009FBA009|nr:hypothetical protein [Pseudonocardia spinosispora]
MPLTSRSPTTSARPVLTRWTPGPVVRHTGPVVVSVTDFTSARYRDLPSIARTGFRLRQGWYAMPGAVGLWLWSLPLQARTGSISVWSNEADLRRFVRLPLHVDVMRHFSPRGTTRATTITADELVPSEILARATRWILDAK